MFFNKLRPTLDYILMWTRRKMLLRQFISKFATQGGVYRKLLCCVIVEWTEDKNPRMVKIVSHFNLSLLFLAFRVEDEALQQRLNDSGCGQTNAIYIFVDRRYHRALIFREQSTRFQGRVVLFMLRCRYSDNRILWLLGNGKRVTIIRNLPQYPNILQHFWIKGVCQKCRNMQTFYSTFESIVVAKRYLSQYDIVTISHYTQYGL